MRLHIHVTGRPAPQGSKRGGAAGQLREASHYLPAWRERVKIDTYRAYDLAGVTAEQLPLLRGAVVIEQLSFRLGGDTRPDGPPDLDKLTRATLDALTQARAWEDDARVVEIRRLSKRRPLPGEQPGADIIIATLEDEHPEESEVKRYRLDLIELTDDPDGDDTEIVSVTGGADVIAVVLPHVGATLGADRASVVMPQSEVAGYEAHRDAPASNGEAPKQRRPRRTKAEMAAARAAEAAAANGGVLPVDVPAQPIPNPHAPTGPITEQQPYNPFAPQPA